jgi:hypothetical protein
MTRCRKIYNNLIEIRPFLTAANILPIDISDFYKQRSSVTFHRLFFLRSRRHQFHSFVFIAVEKGSVRFPFLFSAEKLDFLFCIIMRFTKLCSPLSEWKKNQFEVSNWGQCCDFFLFRRKIGENICVYDS